MAVSKNFMDWAYEMETKFRREKVSFIKFDNQNNQKNGKKRKVGFVAVDEKTSKIAKSFCNPSDNYNPYIGRAIAYARLRGIKIPPMEIYKVKDCIGKTVKYGNDTFYITPILACKGTIEAFYCLRFHANGAYPTGSQLCANTEVELVK